MPRIYSEFRSPCCGQPSENPQTKKSIVLRTIGISVGILGAAIGIYFLTQANLLGGILSISLATPLLFLGIFRGQYMEPDAQPMTWTLSEDERAALLFIKTAPCINAGGYIGDEIIQAFQCLHAGRADDFRTQTARLGNIGPHALISSNAREYLGQIMQENDPQNNPLLLIIETYSQSTDSEVSREVNRLVPILQRIVIRTRLILAQTN